MGSSTVTGALVTGALVTGALATGALATGALATGALATGALATGALGPGDGDGGDGGGGDGGRIFPPPPAPVLSCTGIQYPVRLPPHSDLEPCGVIFPKYEPMAAHGDPFQAGFRKVINPILSLCRQKSTTKTLVDLFAYT